jgi:hypothetical protein
MLPLRCSRPFDLGLEFQQLLAIDDGQGDALRAASH